MAKRKDKPTPINREKFLNNLHDPYQIPEQVEQPYDNSNPDAKYRKPGEPEFLRANEISMKGDTNNVINITLEDHDEAVLYYIQNIIKPTVEINGFQREVPVIYGSPERWKSMQKDGFFRDKNGKAFIPIIAVKRESFEKDRRLGNKLDGNKVQNVQYFKTGYSKRNSYDNFSVLQNQRPSEEYQVGVIPDYITVTYKLSIFTDYVEHMNSIIEAIEFASDSYWGDKERFNFRASITQFPTPTEVVNGNDRAVKSDLTLTINGYIVPKSINVQKAAPSPKSYNVTKFVFKEYSQEPFSPQIDKDGNRVITYTNPSSNNVSYFGTFNGNFIGDGSQLINLPNQNIDTGSLITTSSFNEFTSSYNTGSFVGLFEGNLIGTASYSQNSSTASYYEETDPIFQTSEASLFVTGDKANLDNQSGVNTGDETTSSIKTKRPIKTVNGESLEGNGNIQIDYNDLDNLPTLISNHSGLNLDDGTNPHGTTKSDIGLSNVPNLDTTSAVNNEHTHTNKLILDATEEPFTTILKNLYDSTVSWISTNGTNLINHLTNFANPHNVTKNQVGLSNVDNTADIDKPISTATQTALNNKQDILVSGTNIKTINGNTILGSGNLVINTYSINDKYPQKFWHKSNGVNINDYGDNALSSTGTATFEIMSGGGVNYSVRTTTATAGNSCALHQASFGRKRSDQGGFYRKRFFFDTNGATAFRCFSGIGQVGVIGNIDPSTTLGSLYGLTADSGDSEYHFIYKVGINPATKIPITGWNKTGKKYFILEMEHMTGTSETSVKIINLTDVLTYTATLPFVFEGSQKIEVNNGVNGIAVAFGLAYDELNTDYNV